MFRSVKRLSFWVNLSLRKLNFLLQCAKWRQVEGEIRKYIILVWNLIHVCGDERGGDFRTESVVARVLSWGLNVKFSKLPVNKYQLDGADGGGSRLFGGRQED